MSGKEEGVECLTGFNRQSMDGLQLAINTGGEGFLHPQVCIISTCSSLFFTTHPGLMLYPPQVGGSLA